MPVSSSVQISHCLQYVVALNPKSVLDIGCGFGLWGFLCREYLDVWNLRVQPHEWETRIDGVELWEPYIQPHQRYLYNNIYVRDVRDILPELEEYDLIIAGDVIEHLDKPDAERVLDALYEKARRALIVNIPLTGNWDHPICHGNPGELHRSQWEADDFAAFPHAFQEFALPCGEYGSFYCPKDCPPEARAAGLQHAAQRRNAQGNRDGAIRALRQLELLQPEDPAVPLELVDLLVQAGELADAIATLRGLLQRAPDFHFARLTLARLFAAKGDRAAAQLEAQNLLLTPGLSEEFRVSAGQLLQ
jgi:predicted TPR repeat methyltransferase